VLGFLFNLLNSTFPGLTDQPLVWIEGVLVILALLLGTRVGPFNRFWGLLAKRPALTLAGLSTLTLLLHALSSIGQPLRAPMVSDEFSYLLGADTFLHGRASNPPHPMRASLEAVHVNQEPRYASMYPPAQGLLLAGGTLLGHPLVGPWLAGALLGPLCGWMLLAWMPRRYALLGAIIVALRFGIFTYWTNSYWGGVIPATAGMLLLGALPRWIKRRRVADSLLAALALIILINSRPFETVLYCMALAPVVWMLLLRQTRPLRLRSASVIPAVALLALGAAATLWFNRQLTGNPLENGYQLNMRNMGLAVFPWQSTQAEHPPAAEILQRFYRDQQSHFRNSSDFLGIFVGRAVAWGRFWAFYCGPLLTIPFFAAFALWRHSRFRPFLLGFLLYVVFLTLNPWFFPHYCSPVLGLLVLILVESLRRLASLRNFRSLANLTVPICAAVIAVRLVAPQFHLIHEMSEYGPAWFYTSPGGVDRQSKLEKLAQLPGRHLVLVSISPKVESHLGWVANAADIDASKVVWAHDLDEATNARLIEYFKGRRVWRVKVQTPEISIQEVSAGSH
jgi:hypothetical protein